MKTAKTLIILSIPAVALFLQGCYTEIATTRNDDSYYGRQEQPAAQDDSSYSDNNDNNYDDWQSHNYVGFSYYYPGWCSVWAWDNGCMYPYSPWFWGSGFYFGYAYYPHHWWGGGYGSYYSYYNRYPYSYRPYAWRTSGYQRGGTVPRTYGTVRSSYTGSVGTETRGSGLSVPTAGRRQGSINASTPAGSRGVSTGRSYYRSNNPSVQQPRHRSQSNSGGRAVGGGRSHSSARNSSGSGQTARTAPSYTPAPSAPPARSSAPASAPRSSGGGERSSGGSGRSGR